MPIPSPRRGDTALAQGICISSCPCHRLLRGSEHIVCVPVMAEDVSSCLGGTREAVPGFPESVPCFKGSAIPEMPLHCLSQHLSLLWRDQSEHSPARAGCYLREMQAVSTLGIKLYSGKH